MFNRANCLAGQTLWLWFLFQNERVSKPCMIPHTKQIVSMFGIIYCCEQLFLKINHAKSYAAICTVKSLRIWYFNSQSLHLILIYIRVFANGPGDRGSIPGCVIPKTQKMLLDASLLNIQQYKVGITGKVEQSREGVAPSPTRQCSSYRKGSLRVITDLRRRLYFFLTSLWGLQTTSYVSLVNYECYCANLAGVFFFSVILKSLPYFVEYCSRRT